MLSPIIFTVGLVVGIILLLVRKFDDVLGFLGFIVSMFCAFIIIIMIFIAIDNYSKADAKVAKYAEQYEAITYRATHAEYRDEFGFLSDDVLWSIREWNKDIAYNKEYSHNIWDGILIPDIYDQFERIDYDECVVK